jgi:hypothetical protein
MKPIHIFTPGRHTAMGGATLSFSEADLAASAAAYDPKLHEAPLVVGHPKDNAPAYGWVKGLAFSEPGGLVAEPDQVDTQFAEMVAKGRFKKISASFYSPDAPANPKPGVYYLRHVGFLGAQPPAVKGLRPVEFGEADEAGVVEFADWADQQNASLWRRMREWILTQFGQEAADLAAPGWMVDDLQAAAVAEPPAAASNNNFSEVTLSKPNPNEPTPAETTAAELQAREQQLQDREAAIAAREASFAEREAALGAAEQARRRAGFEQVVDERIAEGKVLPKDRARWVAFMETVADAKVVEFAEGSETPVETPALQVLQDVLKSLPKQVAFGEHARGEPGDHTVDADSPTAIAKAALEFQESERAAGRVVSIELATQHVLDSRAA